ncbi:hypothetical protein C7M84_024525 [Penaeus vannamei]|uniref:Uncharacterized protein n=1 Tax=Penaeus vannamei TaxID=6689 RepID=A0A423U0Q0_PENVA|nr:hypothetical protein C7M84_024525 [Penaeus vannamei]
MSVCVYLSVVFLYFCPCNIFSCVSVYFACALFSRLSFSPFYHSLLSRFSPLSHLFSPAFPLDSLSLISLSLSPLSLFLPISQVISLSLSSAPLSFSPSLSLAALFLSLLLSSLLSRNTPRLSAPSNHDPAIPSVRFASVTHGTRSHSTRLSSLSFLLLSHSPDSLNSLHSLLNALYVFSRGSSRGADSVGLVKESDHGRCHALFSVNPLVRLLDLILVRRSSSTRAALRLRASLPASSLSSPLGPLASTLYPRISYFLISLLLPEVSSRLSHPLPSLFSAFSVFLVPSPPPPSVVLLPVSRLRLCSLSSVLTPRSSLRVSCSHSLFLCSPLHSLFLLVFSSRSPSLLLLLGSVSRRLLLSLRARSPTPSLLISLLAPSSLPLSLLIQRALRSLSSAFLSRCLIFSVPSHPLPSLRVVSSLSFSSLLYIIPLIFSSSVSLPCLSFCSLLSLSFSPLSLGSSLRSVSPYLLLVLFRSPLPALVPLVHSSLCQISSSLDCSLKSILPLPLSSGFRLTSSVLSRSSHPISSSSLILRDLSPGLDLSSSRSLSTPLPPSSSVSLLSLVLTSPSLLSLLLSSLSVSPSSPLLLSNLLPRPSPSTASLSSPFMALAPRHSSPALPPRPRGLSALLSGSSLSPHLPLLSLLGSIFSSLSSLGVIYPLSRPPDPSSPSASSRIPLLPLHTSPRSLVVSLSLLLALSSSPIFLSFSDPWLFYPLRSLSLVSLSLSPSPLLPLVSPPFLVPRVSSCSALILSPLPGDHLVSVLSSSLSLSLLSSSSLYVASVPRQPSLASAPSPHNDKIPYPHPHPTTRTWTNLLSHNPSTPPPPLPPSS